MSEFESALIGASLLAIGAIVVAYFLACRSIRKWMEEDPEGYAEHASLGKYLAEM